MSVCWQIFAMAHAKITLEDIVAKTAAMEKSLIQEKGDVSRQRRDAVFF